jgi:hypothetical protein
LLITECSGVNKRLRSQKLENPMITTKVPPFLPSFLPSFSLTLSLWSLFFISVSAKEILAV